VAEELAREMAEDLLWKGHVRKIVEAILAGKAVPFLGSDINLCDRPKATDGKDAVWTREAPFPPSNQELAAYLDAISAGMGPTVHQQLSCPFMETRDLEQLPQECPLRRGGVVLRLPVQNVSQNLAASGEAGDTALYEALSALFEKDYAPNTLHRFLASLPNLLRTRSKTPTYPLIVTACFDSALERAFEEAGEDVDLVSFIGDAQRGHFQHRTPNGNRFDITEPNKYSGLDLGERPVILKLYGGYESQSFLITEDDYIDYLSHRDMAELIPSSLLRILRAEDTNLWFLGYALSLWNQRVILRRLWQEKLDLSGKPWWAIQAQPDSLDLRIWERYAVKTPHRPDLRLEDYIADLSARLQAAPMLAPLAPADAADATVRETVFFSYSHEDQKWLDQLKDVLTPVTRSGLLREWDDTQIQPGAKWREEIQAALASAKVAVLLVSKAFLKSEFIASEELPTLLKAAEEEGVIICPVVLEDCLYEYSALKDYQAVNDLSKPLIGLTAAKRAEALGKIARKILDALRRN
jgi:hypothetical protein